MMQKIVSKILIEKGGWWNDDSNGHQMLMGFALFAEFYDLQDQIDIINLNRKKEGIHPSTRSVLYFPSPPISIDE
ncbi:hypothetical protein L6452_13675 [Arctium lappa]|uniref:Uncharacterized protein n=1 Tax=Arctium lappa TaxID=4217 RepID=A0ACB9CIW0_ARCLA|nr:hypothetical protein L6452_13675 [Arctium lappa]